MPLLHNKEEILKAAIKKAHLNGWHPEEVGNHDFFEWEDLSEQVNGLDEITGNDIIYRHDFAKAFFLDGLIEWPAREELDNSRFGYKVKSIPLWQYHLSQMVLEEDPISYLAKFL